MVAVLLGGISAQAMRADSRRREAGSGQKVAAEVRGQTTGVTLSHIEKLLWERLSSRDITTLTILMISTTSTI